MATAESGLRLPTPLILGRDWTGKASRRPVPKDEKDEKDEEEDGAAAGDVEEFGQSYYGLLPGDTEASFALLSPTYGTTFEDYDGFWSAFSAVEVRDVAEVDGTTVDVSITYVRPNGRRQDETRRLYLEPTDDGFVIVDDEIV